MDKKQCKAIASQFEQVEFIEKLEQIVRNSGEMAFAAIIGKPVFRGPHCMAGSEPLLFPKAIAQIMFEFLKDYKNNLAETLDDMVVTTRQELEGDKEEEGPEDGEAEDDDEDDGDEVFFVPDLSEQKKEE